ncbi:GATA zinc finger [Niveomyces insectorum RCEF 264]|uniref:GATA zinc finger n=1 Tax=Niveomyces insectorum RCEF 264 TaxID=1081102 RepID=A0A167LQJ2_9HYPO|nr:GATA zinc finger [Niveomyces insectorum RCEF 264]
MSIRLHHFPSNPNTLAYRRLHLFISSNSSSSSSSIYYKINNNHRDSNHNQYILDTLHIINLRESLTFSTKILSRHFEAWSYAEYLARIGSNARTIYNFAEAFGSIAREEHGPQPIPGRMPGDREVRDMINNADWLKTMLENLRGMVQQTVNEHGTSSNRQKPSTFEDMESAVYNESMAKPYTVNEVKKRRGRAAPPGRCHSCNRIDTPEWRRGPDGARTLCNACGLHYAKLERKKQLENRGIRPKHSDERH